MIEQINALPQSSQVLLCVMGSAFFIVGFALGVCVAINAVKTVKKGEK